jgi:hypothetical protein
MSQERESTEIHTWLWLGNMRKTDSVEGLGLDVQMILKGIS